MCISPSSISSCVHDTILLAANMYALHTMQVSQFAHYFDKTDELNTLKTSYVSKNFYEITGNPVQIFTNYGQDVCECLCNHRANAYPAQGPGAAAGPWKAGAAHTCPAHHQPDGDNMSQQVLDTMAPGLLR